MKKRSCVLILACCLLLAACGRLEDIPQELPALPEPDRKGAAEALSGPQFETLTVSDGPIAAEFSLTTRQEQAAFLYVTVEEDCTATVNCTYASDQPVTLQKGENMFCITGGGDSCRMRVEMLDAAGVSYAGAFPEGEELEPLA